MKLIGLGVIGSLVLVACGNTPVVTGTSQSRTFFPQAGVTTAATGTATIVQLSNGDTATVLRIRGLNANQNYVAHYHVQGTAAATPCASGGAPIAASTMTGRTDANGNVELRNLVSSSALQSATYINVHTANDAFAPVDGGMICTNLR